MGDAADTASADEDLAFLGGDNGHRPNLTEQVYEQLIGLLIAGELRPGDVITERRMAERLNASRTPIREALGRLEAEGLVYKQPSRGVTVSPFSTEAFVDILNVRRLLEAEAAYLAAGKIAPERIEAIREALHTLGRNPRPTLAEIWAVDDMLHGDIADAAGILSGSLYHHFDSKESMVDELLQAFQNDLFAQYDEILASAEDARTKLERAVRVSFEAIEQHGPEVAIFQNDADHLVTFERFGYLTDRNAQSRQVWVTLLEEGVRTVLRVKRYDWKNPPADAPSKVYVLDMVVEQDASGKAAKR